MWIVELWIVIALVARALVRVPVGAGLIALAASIALHSGGDWLWLLVAGWFGYHGGQLFFGSLAGFVGRSGPREPSTRRALRRSGMLGRR